MYVISSEEVDVQCPLELKGKILIWDMKKENLIELLGFLAQSYNISNADLNVLKCDVPFNYS